MNFLKSYIHFENTENNHTFDQKFKQVTGRTETMGLEELILAEREKRGEKRGKVEGIKEIIMNMLRKNLPDEKIADYAGVSLKYVHEIKNSYDLQP